MREIEAKSERRDPAIPGLRHSINKMDFLRKLFGKKVSDEGAPQQVAFSNNDMQVVVQSAQRLADVINESLQISNDSHNLDTKLSRLNVAKQKLEELKALAESYPFLTLTSLQEVEMRIERMEFEFEKAGYQEAAEGNLFGERLEREGKIDEAIAQYQKLAEKGVDTPHTYRRLAVLYRKRKQPEDELRALRAALTNVPPSNTVHYNWFQERLRKIQETQP